MLVPNMLRTGRINSRALDGPVRLSGDTRKMLGEIQNKFEAWYRIWAEVYVPKLLIQKSGFKNSRDLAVDDIVYFQKKESELSSPWSLGTVDQIVRGRDSVIRKVIVKYRNSGEDFDRVTDRSARKLIKLYSTDDPDLHADLSQLQTRIDELVGTGSCEHAVAGMVVGEDSGKLVCQCCCSEHCMVAVHNLYGSKTYFHGAEAASLFELEVVLDDVYYGMDDEEDVENQDGEDSLTSLIMGVGRRFS